MFKGLRLGSGTSSVMCQQHKLWMEKTIMVPSKTTFSKEQLQRKKSPSIFLCMFVFGHPGDK